MPDSGRTPEPGAEPRVDSDVDPEVVPEFRPGVSGTGGTGEGLRRRLVAIAICIAVALTIVAVVQRSVEPGKSPVSTATAGRSETPDSGTAGPSAAIPSGATGDGRSVPAHPAEAIAGLLDARAAAIRDGDRAAWLAGLAPPSDARIKRFRTVQGQVFDRVRALRPVSWVYQVAGGKALTEDRRAGLGGAAWLADVELDYQLIAGGPTVHRQQFLTMVRRAGARSAGSAEAWLIADDTDGSTGRDIWDLGPIVQAGSPRCLVVGAQARRAQVEQFAAECAGPAGTVDRAWGSSWPRRTVLTVPDTLTQLAVLLGRSGTDPESVVTAGLEQTAAVTIGPADGAADTVLINGAAFDELSTVGRRVVLTHELVHVATRATGSGSAPTWLAEGYADYVAYADTRLSAEQVAGAALDAVRAGQVPTALPAPDDFNAASAAAATAYGRSWVAVGVIAGKAGNAPRLKAFYQRAAADAGNAGLDRALVTVGLGDQAAFVKVWQARLRQLATG